MGSSSLWLAGDHVLLVHSRGYVETYRRFYFRDIQAIVLRRTAAAWLWALVPALPLVLTLIGARYSDGVGRVSWLIAAGAFAATLLVHALRGASCVCHVSTAVEETELSALRRLRPARKTCERLSALVEQAQGRVAIETLARGAPGNPDAAAPRPPRFAPPPPAPVEESFPAATAVALSSPAAAAVAAASPAASSSLAVPGFSKAASVAGAFPPVPPVERTALRWHATLFALLLADTVLSTAQVAVPSQLLDAGALLLGIAEFLVGIAALLEGRRRRLDTGLRRAAIAGLVYVCAAFVAGWVTSVVGGIQAAIQGKVHQPLSSEWLAIASIPVTAALALWGFAALRRARRAG